MWEQIVSAGIYGAIGGSGGALMGHLFSGLFKNSRFAEIIRTMLTVTMAIIGINFAEPLLSPHIGKYLPQNSSNAAIDREFSAVLEELSRVPTFSAILEREPEMADQLKRQILTALEDKNSVEAATASVLEASHAFIQLKVVDYLTRAVDDDIIKYLDLEVEYMGVLLETDPQFCYDLNYNPVALAALQTIEDVRRKTGPEYYDRRQIVAANVVNNAYDEIPEYDFNIGQAGLLLASQALMQELGQDNIPLITGERVAASLDEATLACRATKVMFDTVLGLDEPATVGRHIFIQAR